MGQRRLATPKGDDQSKRPATKKSNTAVMNSTTTRKGEVFRAQRRTSENVNLRASQHVIDIPVNKSVYNGYGGEQFSAKMRPKRTRGGKPKLRIIPIGGVGEMGIGKNMNAIEYDDEIIIVDMGFLFPGSDYPGINYITPDITWLEENKHKIKAHVFTHGHLDHIGSFRHFIHRIPAPVYASKFTVGMLDKSLADADTDFQPDFRVMDPLSHEIVQVSKHFSVELVRVNHSIPDSTAVVIRTPLGVIIDSGDWRFEESPVDGQKFDLKRMTEVASKEGVLMFMNESTNCESAGTHTHTEFDIQYSIGQVMDKFSNSRVILSCFSSQVHRLQLILEEAHKHGRKVAFAGFSMIQNLEVALRSGTIKIPKNTVMKMEDIIKLPDSQITVVCTGSQGEFNAVLSRMATGAHKYMKIKGSDVVVFSSNPIPGNEKLVSKTVDNLMKLGANVIYGRDKGIHVSGHGSREELKLMHNLVRPKFFMPVHGEYHHLVQHANLARELGMSKENIFISENGQILEFTKEKGQVVGRVQSGMVMVDGLGVGDVGNIVLRDRRQLSQDGILIIVVTMDRQNNRVVSGPDIVSRGFVYVRESEALMDEARARVQQALDRCEDENVREWSAIKSNVRDALSRYLFDKTRRRPMILPIIMEI